MTFSSCTDLLILYWPSHPLLTLTFSSCIDLLTLYRPHPVLTCSSNIKLLILYWPARPILNFSSCTDLLILYWPSHPYWPWLYQPVLTFSSYIKLLILYWPSHPVLTSSSFTELILYWPSHPVLGEPQGFSWGTNTNNKTQAVLSSRPSSLQPCEAGSNLRWRRVGLLKDGGVIKCVAENQRGDTGRSGSEFCKLLGQKSTKRCPKNVHPIQLKMVQQLAEAFAKFSHCPVHWVLHLKAVTSYNLHFFMRLQS